MTNIRVRYPTVRYPEPSVSPLSITVLDGMWPMLGRDAFEAFVRLTAEAIVADLAAGQEHPATAALASSAEPSRDR